VINMSFGDWDTSADPDFSAIGNALAVANSRGVLLVASAGNAKQSSPDFPARDARVLSVAGAQLVTPSAPTSGWQPWIQIPSASAGTLESGTNGADVNGVTAPAKRIVSTLNDGAGDGYRLLPLTSEEASCTDKIVAAMKGDESGVNGDGYGSCTGTSMSAPFVAALGGILRSIYPAHPESDVRTLILDNSDSHPCTSTKGCGMPNATTAVTSMVGKITNRLTPLYAFFSTGRKDRFYTIVPQMAGAAFNGTLQPNNACNPGSSDPASVTTCEGTASSYSALKYTPEGASLNDAYSIPGVTTYISPGYPISNVPQAQVWVFTTPKNPKNAADPLVPLYRLSWKCGDTTSTPPAVCTSTPQHMDVTYTADSAGVTAFKSLGYKLDGIEGYIYPKTSPQPSGTVKLMRKYNPTNDDHAIFPESQLTYMQGIGYTEDTGSDWVGYVYPNTSGTTPAIL